MERAGRVRLGLTCLCGYITSHGASIFPTDAVGTLKIKDTGCLLTLPCSLDLHLVGEQLVQLIRTRWQAKLSEQ